MYYPLSSCLIVFFLFSLFHAFPCASSKLEWCDTLFKCGNITAGFPFRGKNRHKDCSHPFLELHCINNITSLFITNQKHHVLHINQTSYTLTLARADLQGPFCSSVFASATLPHEIFELSPTYKSLTVFYHCKPFRRYYLSYTCLKIGPILVSESPKFPEGCHDFFTVNVPRSFVTNEKKLNMTNLERVLRKGFEVKVKINEKACQECSPGKAVKQSDIYSSSLYRGFPMGKRGLESGSMIKSDQNPALSICRLKNTL